MGSLLTDGPPGDSHPRGGLAPENLRLASDDPLPMNPALVGILTTDSPSSSAPPSPNDPPPTSPPSPLPTSQTIPYWNTNLPLHLHTPSPPPFLTSPSPKDISILSTPSSLFTPDPWPLVQQKARTNRIDLFQRSPLSLRAYLEYIHSLKSQYGSVLDYILTHRLRWSSPITPLGNPFEFEDDVKILWNDWPYGIDERIVHLVVWTKFELEVEEGGKGDLTEEARGLVDGWVRGRFGMVGKDRVIWFKNWRALKSVQAVEHFHVMLLEPDMGVVKEVTGGDVPGFMREEGRDPYGGL